ncbi:hypothetical protein QYF36_025178 [Acer negundo]|nr:hypothetical protein QYF36_025178 [Acer negundo]
MVDDGVSSNVGSKACKNWTVPAVGCFKVDVDAALDSRLCVGRSCRGQGDLRSHEGLVLAIERGAVSIVYYVESDA